MKNLSTRWFVLLFVIVAQVAQGQKAIEVDDEDILFDGNWALINSAIDKRGKLQHYAMTKETTTATATYRPDLPQTGKYHVEIWYLDGKNRSTAAPWVISSAEGETEVLVDQTKNGRDWVRIASGKMFNAGNAGYVQLQNRSKNPVPGQVVLADAVRFVPADSSGSESRGTVASSSDASSITPAKPGSTFALNLEIIGSGSVTRSSEQIRYPANATVTLTARPDAGYVFGGWTGDVDRMLNPLPLTMTSDLKIKANFWAAGIGVIMDNTDATLEGSWAAPTGNWGNARYNNYQYAGSIADRSTATATYQPELPRSGLYDIYVWYVEGVNRATSAPWEISHKGGSLTVTIDQTKRGGEWQLLASGKEFEKGNKGYVRLNNKATPIPSVVVADAVAFVFVGAP